jgi:hypothetical protein
MSDTDIQNLEETPTELSARTVAVATTLIPWAGAFILENPSKANEEAGDPLQRIFAGGIQTSLKLLLPTWEDDQIERTWKDLYRAGILNTPSTYGMMSGSAVGNLGGRFKDYGKTVVNYLKVPVQED